MAFSNAPRAQLNAVARAIAAAQTRVAGLIVATQAVLASDLGQMPVQIVAGLAAQEAASALLPKLYAMGAGLSRIAANVAAAGLSGSPTILVGGDLSFLAAGVYGDATAWTTIARANHLTDPVLEGVNTLIVPPTSDGAGGILIP